MRKNKKKPTHEKTVLFGGESINKSNRDADGLAQDNEDLDINVRHPTLSFLRRLVA